MYIINKCARIPQYSESSRFTISARGEKAGRKRGCRNAIRNEDVRGNKQLSASANCPPSAANF